MCDGQFHAKILQVKSHRDEFDKLFEQEILVESQKGEIFWIFDVCLLCNKKMEGKASKLEFDVWSIPAHKNLSKLHTDVKKIVSPQELCVHNVPNYSAVFYGEIIGKDKNKWNKQFSVDVGSGVIKTLVDDVEYNEYSVGDYIKIVGNIVQLSSINGKVI
ncbi:MAG: hypothetical protein PWQ51_869 [Methanolobus sp.]|jgi:hypothetical protein|nr:hypothetical protein [Methanolobus sp.]